MKKIKKYLSKKEYILFTLSLIIITLSSFSYAFYYNVSDTQENIATTDCFKLEFEDHDEIDIDKGYPLSEEEGSSLKPYQFTIRNVCNAIEEYQINIETINDSTMATNNIRYKLDNRLSQKLGEQDEVLEYVNSNIKESRKIETGSLQQNGEKTYSLRLWIDESSTYEQTSDKTYASKVVIKTVPSVDVTLNTNGGEISQSVVRRTVGRQIGELEEPIKAGYKFLGWYYDSEFTKEVNEEDVVGNKTKNLYAKMSANQNTRYTVEHYQMDTNGNYPATPTTSQMFNGTTDTLVTPEVNTYTGFKSPSAEVVNIDGDGSRVVKYYYERNKYTQTTQGRYMNTSGTYGTYSNIETKDVYYGATYSYSKDATIEYKTVSVAAYTVTEAKTNQVSFERQKYTITYNANGGSVSPTSVTDYYGKSITLPTPTRTGYSTTGWYSATSGGSKFANAGASYTIVGAKSMYAQWSLTSYSITYNLNSGSISGQRTTYDITSSNYTIPIPSKSNNVFAGWTGTGLSEATQNVTISKGATGNRTYTANWKETESVNYSCTNLISTTTANGVTISKASIADKTDTSFAIFLSVTSGSPEYLEAPTWSTTNGQDDIVWVRLNKGTWSRCGTTFNYAGTFNNVQIDSYTTHIYVPNKGIVVAFGYVPNPTVTYNANGGASNTSVVVKKSQGVDLSAKTTRSGYTFVGYANQGSSKILTEFRPGDANRTIYAQWVKSSTTLN